MTSEADTSSTGGPSRAAEIFSHLRVDFLTRTFLKDRGREIRSGGQAFGPLVRRARDRISSLYHFYMVQEDGGASRLDWDFRAIGEVAERVRCAEDHTRWSRRTRFSTRTGQRHDLSGLEGWAVYEDVPGELVRLLEIASVTHVGKHAAFGLGRIGVRLL